MLNTYSRETVIKHFAGFKDKTKQTLIDDTLFIEIINNMFPVIEIPKETLLLVDKFANYLGYSLYRIRSKSKPMELVMARALIAHYFLFHPGKRYTLRQVGLILGGRDHSTASHCKKIIDNMNEFEKAEVNEVMKKFKQIEREMTNV